MFFPAKSSADKVMKENKNYIRKRKPVNFTMDDLNEDAAEDENYRGSPKPSNSDSKRVMPRRRSRAAAEETMKKSTASDEEESD